ncbi:MAG TPA: type II secretion system protein GspK [Phycisphaerae bacterium]|nr:type II secretion system protein GspK [Phycisphaerae bacterium]
MSAAWQQMTRVRGDAAMRRGDGPAGRITPARRRCGARHQRRGMLLLVVLVILSVLALIAASLAYRMEAERIGIEGLRDLQQARLAAESGVARLLLLLRDSRTDMDLWYNNPDAFRKVPVWMPSDLREGIGGTESPMAKEPVENQPAWRYSIVAYDEVGDDKVVMRYGLIDEAGKLNINVASRGELLRLVRTMDLGDTPAEELVDTLIDWRDSDSEMTSPFGAESPWYLSLNPRYRAKNRPFESIEELLMVKNWNGRLLFGEDHNRNGYLDENEDDGIEGAFPPDDGDGKLARGLARLMTVYSWDWNFANDNKPRDDINALKWSEPDSLPEHLVEELSPETIEFLAEVQRRGFKFRSVGELWGLEVYEDGSSNYDDAWEEYRAQVKEENEVPKEEDEQGDQDDDLDPDGDEDGDPDGDDDLNGGGNENPDGDDLEEDDADRGGRGRGGTGRDNRGGRGRNRGNDNRDADDDDSAGGLRSDSGSIRDAKNQRLSQAVRDDTAGGGRGGDDGRSGGRGLGRGRGNAGGARSDDGDNRGGGRRGDPGPQPDDGNEEDDEARKGTPVVSPVTPEQMNVVMDRLTTVKSAVRVGQINVNTAPVEVLQSLIGMTLEEAQAIVARRRTMSGQDKMTPAWVVTTGVLSPEKFAVLSNKLTARSIQFTADVIGFADHVGTFRRLQVVVEMRGHMAQIRYYRDISSLGIGYPVKDDERSEGLAFGLQ